MSEPTPPEFRLSHLMPQGQPPAPPPSPPGLPPEEYNRQAIKQGIVALITAGITILLGTAYLVLAYKGYLPELW